MEKRQNLKGKVRQLGFGKREKGQSRTTEENDETMKISVFIIKTPYVHPKSNAFFPRLIIVRYFFYY